MTQRLLVVSPGSIVSERLSQTLDAALRDIPLELKNTLDTPLKNERILFAVSLNESGVNHGYYDLLAFLRTHSDCLKNCVGGVLVEDGQLVIGTEVEDIYCGMMKFIDGEVPAGYTYDIHTYNREAYAEFEKVLEQE